MGYVARFFGISGDFPSVWRTSPLLLRENRQCRSVFDLEEINVSDRRVSRLKEFAEVVTRWLRVGILAARLAKAVGLL